MTVTGAWDTERLFQPYAASPMRQLPFTQLKVCPDANVIVRSSSAEQSTTYAYNQARFLGGRSWRLLEDASPGVSEHLWQGAISMRNLTLPIAAGGAVAVSTAPMLVQAIVRCSGLAQRQITDRARQLDVTAYLFGRLYLCSAAVMRGDTWLGGRSYAG
jgi:hypothetical protein